MSLQKINNISVDGNKCIVIQDVNNSTITVNLQDQTDLQCFLDNYIDKFNEILHQLNLQKTEYQSSGLKYSLISKFKRSINGKIGLKKLEKKIQSRELISKNYNEIPDLVNYKLNNYNITEFIDSGGFGSVFKGIHSTLNKNVAIKISHEILNSYEQITDLVKLGINTLQHLNNEYIVKTYDIGKLKTGNGERIYLIMEYVENGNLSKLRKTNLTKSEINDRIHLFNKICQGINYAHNLTYMSSFGFEIKGVMHGDLKLENILIDKNNNPKITDFMFIDFGRLIELELLIPEKSLLTGRHLTAAYGSAGHMPIEQQIDGIVTNQSDIYALGILLFELLNPKPFADYKFNSTNEIYEVLKRCNSQTPKFISEIIFKATMQKSTDRYKNVSELIIFINRNLNFWTKIF